MRSSFQRPFNRLEPPQDKQLLPIDRPCLRYKPKSSTTTKSHYHHRKMAIKSQSRSVKPELSGHIVAARGHLQPSVPTINFIDPRSTDLGDRHQPQLLKMPSPGPPNLPLHHPPKWVCRAVYACLVRDHISLPNDMIGTKLIQIATANSNCIRNLPTT